MKNKFKNKSTINYHHNKKTGLTHTTQYYIYVDSFKTPNPNYLKFVPEGHNILGG